MKNDTIAAISTGMTNSGIGIVRISGDEAFDIADRIYKGKSKIAESESHTIHYGHITDGSETIDEVLVMVMKSPRTFTGENTVEINCHGGTFVLKRVLEPDPCGGGAGVSRRDNGSGTELRGHGRREEYQSWP